MRRGSVEGRVQKHGKKEQTTVNRGGGGKHGNTKTNQQEQRQSKIGSKEAHTRNNRTTRNSAEQPNTHLDT